MNLNYHIWKLTKWFGFQIKRYPNADVRNRMNALAFHQITHVIDVGANCGQYASGLRELGYTGKISSFEPQSGAFLKLQQKAAHDPNCDVYPFALGQNEENANIHITQNSFSSSILPMTELHAANVHHIQTVKTESILVRKLDQVFSDLVEPSETVLLKIDTQGYEKEVLLGGLNSIQQITLLQLEMSLFQLYSGETLFRDMLNFLHSLHFRLYALEGDNLSDKKTGQLLQIDGIFINTQKVPEFRQG